MSQLCTLKEWHALEAHFSDLKQTHLKELFKDKDRFSRFSTKEPDIGIMLDYSKNRVTEETMGLLFALAKACRVPEYRDKMFSGEKINFTEGRAVLHTALRNHSHTPIMVDGKDVMPEINQVLAKMRDFCEQVRSGKWTGATGKNIEAVVGIILNLIDVWCQG